MTNQNKSHVGGSRVGPPLTRWSVKNVLEFAEKENHAVVPLKAVHAEVWNEASEAVGWIDAKQFAAVRLNLKECNRCGLFKAPGRVFMSGICVTCKPLRRAIRTAMDHELGKR